MVAGQGTVGSSSHQNAEPTQGISAAPRGHASQDPGLRVHLDVTRSFVSPCATGHVSFLPLDFGCRCCLLSCVLLFETAWPIACKPQSRISQMEWVAVFFLQESDNQTLHCRVFTSGAT